MDVLVHLYDGLMGALQLQNLFWAFVGCFLGTAIGVLPGIGPALTVALLLPITTTIDPSAAFIMFCGVYYGAMYGGSTTSILLNTPGEAGSVMTALEGNRMARAGRAGPALATAAIGSFIAGTIGTLALAFFAPPVAELAFYFTSPDYFALIVISFVAIAVALNASPLRGLASLFLGLSLSVVGIDQQSGTARLTFGVPELLNGMDMTLVLVSMFALGETLFVVSRHIRGSASANANVGPIRMTREDWRRSWKPWLRGTLIGFPIGTIPAGGSEVPTFLSYALEKKLSRHAGQFGKGAIEGVAGPEAANNAAIAGTLVPLLTLGIPTSAVGAILLSAFQNYGIQPGPSLFSSHSELVWTLIASLLIGNCILLILNLPLVRLWVKILQIPRPYLYAGIVCFALAAIWGISNSTVDLILMFFIGLLAYVMRIYSFPVVPVIIGLILGPMAETHLRRALSVSQGDLSGLVSTPTSAVLLTLAAAICLYSLIRFVRARICAPTGSPSSASAP